MKSFARLFAELDETTRTSGKVAAMRRYFTDVDAGNAAWAVYFLAGNRIKRLIPVRRLAAWAADSSGIPEWLFEESYHAVGDLAETITLLLPPATEATDRPLRHWIEDVLEPLAREAEDVQRLVILRAWNELDGVERFVWNKLITGGFRVGVSQSLVVRALALAGGVPEGVVSHRLAGTWHPTAESFARLLSPDTEDADISRPYPFFLAYPLESPLDTLGDSRHWQLEWKWDGIRAQLVRRGGESHLWSRGDEAIVERFPEVAHAAALLPDGTVIDGELLGWRDEEPLPFAQLQRRIGRRQLSRKILDDVPVVLMAYDLLELHGEDVREHPLSWRRERLEALVTSTPTAGRLRLSPLIDNTAWTQALTAQDNARMRGAEGLMLKRLDAPYGAGRRRGPWWKWKVKPFTVDAVMVYAQAGHGRRASLHTDYTFAIWHEGLLVPFAKAYSGLTDEEIRILDQWIRKNTLEKFGPVRSVRPEQVFELAFEGIQLSTRHKSGLAVRFPRILRWRTDKRAADADSMDTVRALMAVRETEA